MKIIKKNPCFILLVVLCVTILSLLLVSCNNSSKQNIHEHRFGSWIVTKEPTCVEDGVKGRKCLDCGYVETESIPSDGSHSPIVDIARVEPTCTEEGHTEQICCEKCHIILQAKESIPALGHLSVDDDNAVQPTCQHEGLTSSSHCSRCGTVLLEQETIEKLEHVSVSDNNGIQPTCVRDGWTSSTHCSQCGTVLNEQEILHCLGHDVVIDGSVEPQCEHEGLTQGEHCQRCGAVLIAQQIVECLGHSYGEWIVDLEPSIDREGSKHRVCSRCQKIETASIDKHNVNGIYDFDDNYHWEECLDCHEILNYGTHTYGEWFVDTNPTCVQVGQKHKSCTVCGRTIYDTVDVIDHNYGDWIIDIEPALSSEGKHHRICSVCGHTETQTIPMLEYSTITFYLNGGQSASYVQSKQVASLSKDDFFFDVEKDGFNFRGWICDGAKIFDEDGNLINNIRMKANMTFIATWSNRAKLRIFTNMLEAGTVSAVGEYEYNTQVSISATPYQGYNFVGWYTYEEGLPLSSQQDYSYQMWDKDVNISAIFELAQFSLNIESNNGDNGEITINPPTAAGATIYYYHQRIESITYKDEVTVAAFTKSSYRFLGWFDDVGALVTTNAIYKFVMPNYDYHLTAKWDYFTITYNLDGGTNAPSNPTSYTLNTPTIQLAEPTRAQREFVGWKLNGEFVTEIDTQKGENIVLTAIWIYYTLTTNTNLAGAGTYTDSQIVQSGESMTVTASTNPGYTWLGWYDGDTQLTVDQSYTFVMPKTNVTYTAKWICYTLTTSTNLSGAGTYTESQIVQPGISKTITASTNNGYIWLGWYEGNTCLTTELSYSFIMPYSDVHYIAKWQSPAGFENFYFSYNGASYTITGVRNKNVAEIVVPENTAYISPGAFSGCSKIESITIPFIGSGLNSYYPFGYIFGTNSYDGGVATEQCYYANSNWTYITYYIPSSLKNIVIINGNIQGGAFYNCKEIEMVAIPSTCQNIGKVSFAYCFRLNSIEIPNGVRSIGESAFYACGFSTIEIPNSVTSIGTTAFKNCTRLQSAIIENGLNSASYAFNGCSSLKDVTLGSGITIIADGVFEDCALETITIPQSVTTIRSYAFWLCDSLTTINLSSNITTIDGAAFYQCTSLSEINFDGTMAQWQAISKAGSWDNATGTYTIYCSDGFINKGVTNNL